MRKKLIVFAILIVGVLMASYLWLATAQEKEQPATPPAAPEKAAPPAPATGERMGEGGGARMTPEQLRERYFTSIKESLGATDEQWTALKPKVEKIFTLSRGLRSGMAGRPGAASAQLSDVQLLATELRTLLDNKESKPEDVKAKLTALRAARDKAKAELTAAQDDLKKGLNERQEAQLVLMGLIE